MINDNRYTHHPFNRFYTKTLKKHDYILSLLIILIGMGLLVGMAAEAGQGSRTSNDQPVYKSPSVDNYQKGVENFVKVEKKGAPIMSGAGSSASVYGIAKSGDILQFLDSQMVIIFGNTLGSPTGGNGTWHGLKMLDGREGWIWGLPISKYFDTNSVYAADIGGGSTLIQRDILRIQKTIIFEFGSNQVALRKGDFLLIIEKNPAWVTLESVNGLVGRWREEDIMRYGNFETIPWYPEWDAMRKRKSPLIIFMLSAILIAVLVLFTIYNDPRHPEKGGRKAVSLIYFGLISFGIVGSSLSLLKGSVSLAAHLSLRRFDAVLETISLMLILPYGIVLAFFFEGFVVFSIRCKYMFSKQSVQEVIMERTKTKESNAKKHEYETKKEEIDTRRTAIQKKLSNLRSDLPEVIDAIPADLTDYQGYWNEVEKRFQERQIMKTTKVARERLEEVRRLCEEGAKLQRARADLEMANHEFSTVDKEISLKDKERTLKDKILDRDILETDADIARLKRMSEKKEEREDFGI